MVRTIIVGVVLTACSVWAHGGGLDRYGCHHDRKRGGYHCHGGGGGNSRGGSASAAPPPATSPPRKAPATEAPHVTLGATRAEVQKRYPAAKVSADGQLGVIGSQSGEPVITCYRFIGDRLAMIFMIMQLRGDTGATYERTKRFLDGQWGPGAESDNRLKASGNRFVLWRRGDAMWTLMELPKSTTPAVQLWTMPVSTLKGPDADRLLAMSPVCIPARTSDLEL